MKKILALVLAFVMVFALCGVASADNEATDATAVKFGLICLHDENSTYDNNFITAAQEACEAMGAELVLKTNVSEGEDCY